MIKDTAKPLWKELFRVLIPQLFLRSAEDISNFGSYTTLDKGIDSSLTNQWVNVMIPIVKMVEIYQEGGSIRIVDEKDTKIIYELISEHLSLWESTLRTGINIGDAPVSDLLAMDTFAQALYPHAKQHFSQDLIGSILGREMIGMSALNPQNFFVQKKVSSLNDQNDDNDRASMSDFFKGHLMNLNNR